MDLLNMVYFLNDNINNVTTLMQNTFQSVPILQNGYICYIIGLVTLVVGYWTWYSRDHTVCRYCGFHGHKFWALIHEFICPKRCDKLKTFNRCSRRTIRNQENFEKNLSGLEKCIKLLGPEENDEVINIDGHPCKIDGCSSILIVPDLILHIAREHPDNIFKANSGKVFTLKKSPGTSVSKIVYLYFQGKLFVTECKIKNQGDIRINVKLCCAKSQPLDYTWTVKFHGVDVSENSKNAEFHSNPLAKKIKMEYSAVSRYLPELQYSFTMRKAN